jgi:hypothetical protein
VLVRRAACRTAREYLNCELTGGSLGAFGKLRTEAMRLGAHAHTKALIDLVRLTLKRPYHDASGSRQSFRSLLETSAAADYFSRTPWQRKPPRQRKSLSGAQATLGPHCKAV